MRGSAWIQFGQLFEKKRREKGGREGRMSEERSCT